MRKIDLVLEEISDSEILRRVTERMKTIKFKELLFEKNEKTEIRISSIVSFIIKQYPSISIYVSQLDATGKLGNELGQRLNEIDRLLVPNDHLINLLNEDGQVFEGTIELIVEKGIKEVSIQIQDGICVDIYETNLVMPDEIIGNYRLYIE